MQRHLFSSCFMKPIHVGPSISTLCNDGKVAGHQ